MSVENQGERKKFNFEELLELAMKRDRQIRSSPYLQDKLLKSLNEGQFDSDDSFYDSDDDHYYEDTETEFGLDYGDEQEEFIEPQTDAKTKIGDLVRTVEQFCASNFNEDENPEVFSSCNQLLSCFYAFKAKGTPGPDFGVCILDLYRKLKSNTATTLANQYTTESIFDTLEELNQLIGAANQGSMVHNSFSSGF